MAPLVLLLAAALHALPSGFQDAPAPAIVVSARYPASTGLEEMRAELPALASAGYNAVTTTITWRDGEPQRGVHNLLPLDQLVAVASSAGLGVRIQVVTSLEPEWKKDGTNALAGTFFDYVRRRFERRPGVLAVMLETVQPTRIHRTIAVGSGEMAVRAARFTFWSDFIAGVRSFDVAGAEAHLTAEVLAFGTTAGVVTRNESLFAPVQPRSNDRDSGITISGGDSVVVRVLESAQAILIVARNTSAEVRQAAITFPPDMPEAIWQNMEHGNSVHFVAGPSGPVLEHKFGPQDVLVLAIRKTLR